jgi:hypothetical protein
MLSAQAVTHKKFDGGKDRKEFFFMKKTIWKLIGIIALAAIIGLGLTGCSTDSGGGPDDGDDGKIATIKITNNSGRELTFYAFVYSLMASINKVSRSIAAGATETLTLSYAHKTDSDIVPTHLRVAADVKNDGLRTDNSGIYSGLYSGSAPLQVIFDGTNFIPDRRE